MASAEAFKNEPEDFRGITWGASYEQHASELKLVRQDDDVFFYTRSPEKMMFGRAEVVKVAYRFFKGKFNVGVIQTYGSYNKRELRDALTSAYGQPVRLSKRQELDSWNGDAVQIVLSCSVTTYCAAEFISKEMIAWEETETGSLVNSLFPGGDDD
jgi:hypothetical protein